MRVGLTYDFANPPQWRRDPTAFVQREIEQAVWGEELGIDAVFVPEHHFTDGYPAAPLTLVTAIAARTSRVKVGTAILVGPLHHPVRIAEETATIDLISGGRVELGIGLGWAAQEYACFGVAPTRRVSLLKEIIDVVRLAWTNDELSYHGSYFDLEALQVLPKPVQRPHPPIWGGALTPAGGRRIGEWGLGLMWLDREVALAYIDGWRSSGRPAEDARIDGYLNMVVCDDPEAAWQQIRPHFVYQRSRGAHDLTVAAGGTFVQRPQADARSVEAERAAGKLLVVTPDRAVAEIRRRAHGLPVSGVFCPNSICGMPDELSDRHVELLATVVAPALRDS